MSASHRQLRLALLAMSIALAPASFAQEFAAPTYARTRGGGGGGGGGGWQGGGWHGGGWGGGYGFVQPFFPQPIVTGSWYQRPYPYHFDYYRNRWGGTQQAVAPTPDCPCAAGSINAPAPMAAP